MDGPAANESFESCLGRLKALAAELDNPDLPLEEYTAKIEQAQAFANACNEQIEKLKRALAATLHH